MTAARIYPVLGGVVGAAVTAAFWFGTGNEPWWDSLATLVGAVIGAFLGSVFGIGEVKEEWSGWFGAAVMPAILVAFANFTLFLIFAASSP
jgi:hypothetical protein